MDFYKGVRNGLLIVIPIWIVLLMGIFFILK